VVNGIHFASATLKVRSPKSVQITPESYRGGGGTQCDISSSQLSWTRELSFEERIFIRERERETQGRRRKRIERLRLRQRREGDPEE